MSFLTALFTIIFDETLSILGVYMFCLNVCIIRIYKCGVDFCF